jgi:CRP-like cAMP-binding protein
VNIIVDPALVDEGQRSGTKPQAIATLRRGQSFGELALVDEGIRSASAQCTSAKADLLLIPRTELLDLCDMDRDLGYKLMRNIASDLATKLRTTDLLVRDQLLRKSPESTHKDR